MLGGWSSIPPFVLSKEYEEMISKGFAKRPNKWREKGKQEESTGKAQGGRNEPKKYILLEDERIEPL